jgi:oligoendopeptidase F
MAAVLMLSVAVAGTASEEKLFYEDRADIPEPYRWDLDLIFEDLDTWEAAYAKVEQRLPELAAFKGRLGESADVMLEATELLFGIARNMEDVYVYAFQWQSTDTRNADANAYVGRAQSLYAAFGQATAFFEPEIVQLPDETIAAYLEDPRLATYAHVIDNVLRTKAHTRSQEVEEVLAGSALLQGAPNRAYGFLKDSDTEWPMIKGVDGEDEQVVEGLYYTYLSNQDRRYRKDAALAIFSTFEKYANTYSATYNGLLQKDVWLAKVRNYESALDMELNQTNVPASVVETLVSTVHDNLDALHAYVDLRSKVMGLDKVHIYDLYVSMVPDAEATYTYDEGWALAMEFWKETFGEEYAAVAERGQKERWVDVYPNAGKRSGAYSYGTYNSVPYLFLNWGGTFSDVSTLVHEMGHSIHSYLANQNQPYHDADYSLSWPRSPRWDPSRCSSSGCSRATPTRPSGWRCSTPGSTRSSAPSCGRSSSTSSSTPPTSWPPKANPLPRNPWAKSGAICGSSTTATERLWTKNTVPAGRGFRTSTAPTTSGSTPPALPPARPLPDASVQATRRPHRTISRRSSSAAASIRWTPSNEPEST